MGNIDQRWLEKERRAQHLKVQKWATDLPPELRHAIAEKRVQQALERKNRTLNRVATDWLEMWFLFCFSVLLLGMSLYGFFTLL
jgi:hypothetical protein